MIRKAIILLIGTLLMASIAFADEAPKTIQSMTDLGEIQRKLDQGITIGKVYYTDGYGSSTGEFTTDDPSEIALLWDAVNAIRVGEKVDASITDWYPQIVFCLTDKTSGGVRFEAKWLCVGGTENYEITHADAFWSLTASLMEKHQEMEEMAVPGGWHAASDLTIVPKEAARDGLPDGRYCIGVRDTDHLEDGYFILSLYAQDLYDRGSIENLKRGDKIIVHGETFTVGSVRVHGWYDTDGDGEKDASLTFEKHPHKEMTGDGDSSEAPASFEISPHSVKS